VLVLAWVLISLHIVLAWASRSPGISWGEDDAEYIILGQEILQGDYSERWDVDAPAHARLPPGFPALLSIGNVVFGDSVAVYTMIVLICSAASIALFFMAVRRHFGDGVALFVTGLTAVNVMAVSDAGQVMAEAPFRFWATLTLWSASRENPSPRHLVLAGVAAVMAALTRSIGVAVLAALALHWILERRWKAIGLLAVGSIPVGAWFLWTLIAPDPNQRALYLHTVVAAAQESAAERQESAWIATLKGMARTAALYLRSHVPAALSFFGLKANPIDNFLWAALAIVTIPVALRIAWQRWRLLVLLLVFYGAALVAWPWRNERFVSPTTSMLLVLIAIGATHWTRRWSARAQRLALAAVASFFVVGSIQFGLPTLRAKLACDRSKPLESPTCFTEDRRGLLKLAAYARENTPQNALFFTPKEGAFYWHSGRRTMRSNRVRITDSLGVALRQQGVSYAVLSPIGVTPRRHSIVISRACREFETVATFEGGSILLRRRENGPIDHDDETCQLLAEWKDGIPARLLP
jgi:hypothetical protein